jgi:hypothetical protein
MTNRSISRDSLALGNSLDCTIPTLRSAALAHIESVILAGGADYGGIRGTAAQLGVSLSTYQRWIALAPELRAVYERMASESKIAKATARAKTADDAPKAPRGKPGRPRGKARVMR